MLIAAGFEDAAVRLDGLARRLSCLTLLPSTGGAPRYGCHDLFRDFLEHRVDLLEEANRRELKLRAAAALESCGQTVAALRLFAESGASQDALRLIRRDGFELVAAGHEDTIELALQSLPAQHATDYAVLAVRGRQAYRNARTERAAALFERAVASCDDTAYAAKLCFWQSIAMMAHYKDPIAVLEPVAANEDLALELQAELNCALMGAYLQRDLSHDIEGLFRKISRLAERIPGAIDRSRILSSLGRFVSWRGNAPDAERLLQMAADLAAGAAAHREEARAYESLAGNNIAGGRFDRALRLAELSASAAEKCGARVSIISALCHRVTALFNAGCEEELDATLARMEALAPSGLAPVYTFSMLSGRAMSAAWKGDFAGAHRAAGQTCGSSKWWEARMIATARCALYLAADGRHADAIAVAKRAMDESRTRDWTRSACARYYEMSSILCALTHALCGDRSTMRRLLHRRSSKRRSPARRCALP